MSKKKNDKPSEPMDEGEEPEAVAKAAPWAVEIEFLNKPSFMCSITELRIDGDRIVVTKDDGSIHTLPYGNVSKVLVMNTTKRKYSD
jgi:hypothetical protein